MKKPNLNRIILSAMFLTIGIILPFFTGQIKEAGDSLLPMHIPVMLCGVICGSKYGLAVGFLLPYVRSALFFMPPMYPNAVWMSLELATYGFVIGMLYYRKTNRPVGYLYFCIISAMIAGRIVWGIAKTILLGLDGSVFTFHAFIVGGFVDAIPGIILQLILIPSIIGVIKKQII